MNDPVSSMDAVSGVLFVILFFFGLFIYFVPSIVGGNRRVESWGWLLFVNFLTGWTAIGWFACLLWAVLGHREEIRY